MTVFFVTYDCYQRQNFMKHMHMTLFTTKWLYLWKFLFWHWFYIYLDLFTIFLLEFLCMFFLHRGVFVNAFERFHHVLQLFKLIGQLLDFSICLACSLVIIFILRESKLNECFKDDLLFCSLPKCLYVIDYITQIPLVLAIMPPHPLWESVCPSAVSALPWSRANVVAAINGIILCSNSSWVELALF